MSNFIFERNIARYKELLATETDPKKIAMHSASYGRRKKPSLLSGAPTVQYGTRQNKSAWLITINLAGRAPDQFRRYDNMVEN
jgi:hypothetical protein